MKHARQAVGILLALLMLLGTVPAVSASPQRDTALDGALNYEDCELTFTSYTCRGGDIEIVTEGDRTYAVLMAADEEQGDNTTWVKLKVVAEQGDRLIFDHASSLDYMDGATVGFGYMNGSNYVEIYSNEEESGDGIYDGETVEEWETFQYEIPADGEYEFMWRIDAYNNWSKFAIDDVLMYPAMTVDRAINAENSALHWTNDSSYPWQPAYNKGRICMKSGAISHNGSTSLTSNSVILRAGDIFSADIATDSESGYDKLNIYYTRTSDETPQESLLQSYSGAGGQWSNRLSWPVPEDGMYSFRVEYKKDNSVSSGSDSVFISNTYAPKMGLAHAAAPGFEEEIEFSTYYQDYVYPFTPVFRDGEIMLTSTNQGVHSTVSLLLIGVDLNAGESIAFDYYLDSEDKYDYIRITDNSSGTEYFTCKADTNGFETYSFCAEETGEYVFRLIYSKDSSVNQGEDTALLKNFRIIPDDLSAALRRDDAPFLEFSRGTNGGQIELVNEGDRYYAQVSDFDSYAIASTSGYRNQNEYVIFDYKVVGDDAKLEFWAYDGCENEFYADGSDEWHTYYYRLPASDIAVFDWFFEPGEGGTVCVDNVYIGYIYNDFKEALNHPDTESEANPTYIENFIGRYDPYEPRGVTKYVYADPEAGHMASFDWDVEAEAGDYYEFLFKFFDEDGEANGSSFRIYQDGEDEGEFYDTDCGTSWWKLTMTFTQTAVHTFRVEFYSEGTMGGDGFAVSRAKLEAIGVTLDEALNEEGGTLQFSGPEEGGFIPAYDEATDRYIGMPAYAFDPENEVDMEFTFDSGAEVNDWTFIDADSSGHSFVMDDPSPYVGFSSAFGSNSLLSGPLFENGTVTSGGVDNWAITPTFTVPVGGNAGSGFSLLYAAASALYHETLELWVLPEGELENAVLIDSVTAETGSWESIGCSLIDYQGQTVAIGMRHCTAHNACGLIIDEVYLSCEAPHYARVSFSRSMRVTDELKYDLRVDAFGRDEISGNIFVTVYEDGVNIANYDGQSLFANYGENWRTCYTSAASSNGRHTYTFVFSWLDRTEPDFRIYLDNVGIVSVAAPIDLIVVTDYDVPEAGTLPGDNEPSVPAGCGYYIDTVVWFGEDEYAMSDDEVFEAGGSYDLLIRVFAEDGYAFTDDVQLYVENDPGAEILWLSEEYAVIMFSEVTIPAASGLPGDANGDGILSSADLSALFAYVMNAGSLTEQGLINADVNGDGLINTVDVTILSQLIFGA